MTLIESGKGGMARVKEILTEQFSDKTAVAMFRVTAVDDRENTVSYRTKLIHVIFTGPQTPVMKRAKIASFNAAFKQPFSANLYIQTDDVDGDLNETSIERSLRASGGAHQPTRFDFLNSSAPGEGETKVMRAAARSPSHASPSPSASPAATSSPRAAEPIAEIYPSTEEVLSHHNSAWDAKDIDAIAADYSEDAKLFHTDANTKRTTVYSGPGEIAEFFRFFIDTHGDTLNVTNDKTTGNIHQIEYNNVPAGYHYGADVFYVLKGKIVLQTITTVSGSADETVEPAAEPLAPNEVYDGVEKSAEGVAEEAVAEATDDIEDVAAEEIEVKEPTTVDEEEPAQAEEQAIEAAASEEQLIEAEGETAAAEDAEEEVAQEPVAQDAAGEDIPSEEPVQEEE
jgi:hypothetical protein